MHYKNCMKVKNEHQSRFQWLYELHIYIGYTKNNTQPGDKTTLTHITGPYCGALQWSNNEPDGISNHQPHNCLHNRLFRRRSKKTSKLCVTGLCEGNLLVTGEFPAQRASNVENVSIWWCHHGIHKGTSRLVPQKPSMAIAKLMFWCFCCFMWA